MKISSPTSKILTTCIVVTMISSCATFRGMPSHGGGKRFDEEQRVITAAIRHAAQKMDFSKLKGRKIAIEVTGLETSGTGQPFYPGLGEVELALDGGWDKTKFSNTALARGDNRKDDRGLKITPNYQFNPSLRANNNITRQDIEYLSRALEMRLRHDGFQIVPLEVADTYLVVLVDALGTNLSRKDYGVAYDDDLSATCEMTYYAIHPQTQNIIAASKAVASEGKYMERNIRFTPYSCKERGVKDFNGRIAPLATKAPGSFKSGRSSIAPVYINPNKQIVNDLVQEAEVHLEANDALEAAKTIKEIQRINPDHPDLPELKQQLKQL